MTTEAQQDWKKDFGLDGRKSPTFFSNAAELSDAANSAGPSHILRRAFDDLDLVGVLCQDNNPVIYFRQMDELTPERVAAVHRTFWNQGVAPILVLIAQDEVHIYSSLSEPSLEATTEGHPAGFVERLDRVADQLQAFILAVESKEYFRHYRRAFDPKRRVDRNLLRNLESARSLLAEVPATKLSDAALDALLCRLVFTCYLFDRKVIDNRYLEDAGIRDAKHLRDILGRSKRSDAKAELYMLFSQLGEDFNGDLFSDNLDAEARHVRVEHLDIINHFFRGTDPHSGQQSFWPYEFGVIPIETISAIYEHFLKSGGDKKKKESGAFYTPRFLAELVLDLALSGATKLLDKRFLDPACGSGIFLVGLFNRLAEEWTRENPKTTYDAKLKGLTKILETNLYGNDKNPTACRIASFSLYLALLDQLSPPDIRRVLKKVKVLPRLLADEPGMACRIRCADFFTSEADLPEPVDYVIGNPPWAKAQGTSAATVAWCDGRRLPLPGKQVAAGFIWKAPDHLTVNGKACFVLPHGLLFNHTLEAVEFQQQLFQRHAVSLILNLTDYQRFLFEDAEAPALVVSYTKAKPADNGHRIDYWSPKTDWAVTQAEVLSILPQDRAKLTVREILSDLRSDDAPLIWKERFWATTRDRRLLDRLKLYPRLRNIMGKRGEDQRWVIAEGYEPFIPTDKQLYRFRIADTAKLEGKDDFDFVILPTDYPAVQLLELELGANISNIDIFKKPLVLVTEGFSKIAFANFNIAYRHGIRGIHGPIKDTNLLIFLTFYLRSSLARYFLFHTSASWGVSRARIDINDLMRLPFPLPEDTDHPERAAGIVVEVGELMSVAMQRAKRTPLSRDRLIQEAQSEAEALIEEFFDINDTERILIEDTDRITIPSVRPSRSRSAVPTLLPAKTADRDIYTNILASTLNQWAHKDFLVHGKSVADGNLGIGMVVLEKVTRGQVPIRLDAVTKDILATLRRLQRTAGTSNGVLELVRGLKVFDSSLLYVIKPIGMRFWTRTAALNDADEIADTLLMRSEKGDA
jgi:hypothetical protein